MKSYRLINFWSVKEELKKLENSSNFISPNELKKIQHALYLKKHLEDNGFHTTHFEKQKKVDPRQKDVNFVFNAYKQNYKFGDSSHTFYGAVFSVYNWLYKSGEIRKYELI